MKKRKKEKGHQRDHTLIKLKGFIGQNFFLNKAIVFRGWDNFHGVMHKLNRL